MDSPLTTTIKKPCFLGEEDNSLASIYHNNNNNNNNNNGYFVDNENHMMRRRNSLRNISSLSNNNNSNDVSSSGSNSISTNITTVAFSSRSRFDDVVSVYSPHYLESCALCRLIIPRGDTPFCSEECRQEQIEMDEAKEKNWKLKSLRTKKDANKKTSSSATKPQNYSYRTSTVAAA